MDTTDVVKSQDIDNPIKRNEKGQFVEGNPPGPGRPRGKTMKEYVAEKFRTMTDEEKIIWLKDRGITGIDEWKMAEGQPAQQTDLTSGGKPIYIPSELLPKNDLPQSSSDDSQ